MAGMLSASRPSNVRRLKNVRSRIRFLIEVSMDTVTSPLTFLSPNPSLPLSPPLLPSLSLSLSLYPLCSVIAER